MVINDWCITAQLIGALVLATQTEQSLFFLNLKFQASKFFLHMYSLVCIGPGWTPKLLVFSCESSCNFIYIGRSPSHWLWIIGVHIRFHMILVLWFQIDQHFASVNFMHIDDT